MFRTFGIMAACAFLAAAPASAAVLTFDNPDGSALAAVPVPTSDPDYPFFKPDYSLGGLTFSNGGHDWKAIKNPIAEHNAHNGTYLFENGNADLSITANNGSAFTLNGFDFGPGFYGNNQLGPDHYGYNVDFILTLVDGSTQTFSRIATSDPTLDNDLQHIDFGGLAVTKLVISANNGWIAIDNLDYDAGRQTIGNGAVPEPASWAMMVGGFGLVGGALRRSRVRTAVA